MCDLLMLAKAQVDIGPYDQLRPAVDAAHATRRSALSNVLGVNSLPARLGSPSDGR